MLKLTQDRWIEISTAVEEMFREEGRGGFEERRIALFGLRSHINEASEKTGISTQDLEDYCSDIAECCAEQRANQIKQALFEGKGDFKQTAVCLAFLRKIVFSEAAQHLRDYQEQAIKEGEEQQLGWSQEFINDMHETITMFAR